MAASLSCTILTIELVLYLTTVTSVSYFELVPIAKEVDSAIKKMDLPKQTKDAFAKHYINVGGYSSSFIELLGSYRTMSSSPIRFNEKEKSILTLSSLKDPIEYKVRTQLKYYRKMQEVQCTDYIILYHKVFETKWNIQHFIQHVYNMIKMAYIGKFVVFKWLLKFRINLEQPETLNRNLKEYKKYLGVLVNMCIQHKYIVKKSRVKESFKQIMENDEFNTQLHIRFNNNESPLPLSVDHLYLGNIRRSLQRIEPITSNTIGWDRFNGLFKREILKTNAQLSTKEWIMDPFTNIRFQQMFLDIVMIKLYCFVWLQLYVSQSVYVSVHHKYRHDHLLRLDFFMSMISDIVEFINIENKTLDEVLTLYCTHEKGKSNYEQNEKLLKIIETAIINSLKLYFHTGSAAVVSLSKKSLKNERTLVLVLHNIEKKFLEFVNFLGTTLDGFSLNFLLFFVNGSRNTELAIFP